MYKIPDKYLKKYNYPSLEESRNEWLDEVDYYLTFLLITDHIPNKIIESQYVGNSTEDYSEIIEVRNQCRKAVNELR